MSETNSNGFLARWLPPLVGGLFVSVFIALGIWQLDRAAQKNATTAAFEKAGEFVQLRDVNEVERLQSVSVTGRYLADQQIVIPNIVQNDRIGYYVISAFRTDHLPTLLAVNRGWIAKPAGQSKLPDLIVNDAERTLRGKIGGLPRVAIRPGPVFKDHSGWPRIAIWPELPDLAAAWQQDVAPLVLLLDPQDADGFSRQWLPPESGALTHYSYAFQWFVMAAGALALLLWRLNKLRNAASSA